ncbi:Hint domain-containing protein [Acidisoma cellulosilytica]|uniref:Hint domain-containing protein n=1 Tax=Acidisoma cellulosilyticum TaxID=2802395 RepID=A0A964E3W9_9PROT|nr:Hint domain-containing protein [Acidisoma cellulosilyticum]MCB8881085.1 Hint domain-containing protein [Acidisoma cellulosilyticum]
MATVSNANAVALGANVATALYGVTGAGVKIGIISDSFDALGGAAQDMADGNLPTTVTVLNDNPTGADEGRAMTELAYQIAPGASYYFAAGGDTVASCAAAVAALQAAGCTIIIDDLGYGSSESFFQTGTVLDNAIQTAVAAGVSYFSAAGNDGQNFIEQGFTPLSVTVPGIGDVVANDFGDGSPYTTITLAEGEATTLLLEWAQPFATIGTAGAGAQNSLAFYLIDSEGNVVAESTESELGGDPTQGIAFTNTTTSTQFTLVVVQNGGVVPTGQQFIIDQITGSATFDSADAGTGSGNILGHELLTDTNVVGAVTYSNTPAYGQTPVPAAYTSTGPGEILFDVQGNPLATPIVADEPNFVGVSGSDTSVPGFAPFSGTSAAAPNVGAVGALMLQANSGLTTTEVTALLEQSTIPVDTTIANAGEGLVQARAAVELAAAALGARWSDSAGGNWNDAAAWSTGTAPTTDGAAMLSDDLGAITGSYTVTVDTASDAAGSLTLSAPAGSSVTLAVAATGVLAIGGPATSNITAGDFLVATGGTLSIGGGTLNVAGSLNVNDGIVLLAAGQITANNYAQIAGGIAIGGASGDGAGATISLTGTLGIFETGGEFALYDEAVVNTTTALFSDSTFSIGSASDSFNDAGQATFYNTGFIDAGSFTSTALEYYGGEASIIEAALLSTSSLSIGSATSVFTLAGTLDDAGELNIGMGTTGGTIGIEETGSLTIGSSASGVGITFSSDGGWLDFASADSAVLATGLTSIISGFQYGSSVIEFGALTYDANDSYSFDDGALSIYDGSTLLAALALDSAASYAGFDLKAGADDQLEISAMPCFAAGTQILTERGPVAVEHLTLDDRAITADGRREAIVWIGSRRVDCRRHAMPGQVLPVRVAAQAFGPQQPARDLYLSPDHALFVDGVLIPVKHLIDGAAIRQVDVDAVTYFHVELGRHQIVLAEGLAVESYLDTGDRAAFAAGQVVALHPAWGPSGIDASLIMEAMGYAPLRVAGVELDRARAMLAKSRHATEDCVSEKRAWRAP